MVHFTFINKKPWMWWLDLTFPFLHIRKPHPVDPEDN